MLQVKVVKASSTNALEEKINLALNGLSHVIVKDIKIAGSYDGRSEIFTAVILYDI